MSLLKHPSVKLHVKHLKNCESIHQIQDDVNASKSSLQSWTCTLTEGPIIFSVVWIQGHILKVESDGSRATITDDTGEIDLIACDKVTGKPEIKEGMYMMAVGTLTGSPGSLEIKPFKLQNLSGTDQARECWHLEVIDQIYYLTNQAR